MSARTIKDVNFETTKGESSSAIPSSVLATLEKTVSYTEGVEEFDAPSTPRRGSINPLGRLSNKRAKDEASRMYLPWVLLMVAGAMLVLGASLFLLLAPSADAPDTLDVDHLNALISGGAPGVTYDIDDATGLDEDALLRILGEN